MVQREADRQRARRVARAGDFLQVAVKVFALGDSPTLTGAIGLFAEAGGSTGGETPSNPPSSSNPDGGTSIVTAPASLRIRNALRGIRISVNVPGAGARVVATLSARGIGRIASVRRSGVAAGQLSLRLRPQRRAVRRLRRARSLTATPKVTVSVPGQAAQAQTVPIRLRR